MHNNGSSGEGEGVGEGEGEGDVEQSTERSEGFLALIPFPSATLLVNFVLLASNTFPCISYISRFSLSPAAS